MTFQGRFLRQKQQFRKTNPYVLILSVLQDSSLFFLDDIKHIKMVVWKFYQMFLRIY